jgi:homoserine kinase type II
VGRTVDLDREEIQSILSLYHIDDLGDFGLVRSELFNTLYWVQALKERFFLRVGLRRRFSDMVFEKDFLGYLKDSDLPIPRLVENVASGAFTPWSSRGRYVSLYQFVDGRILGLFQLESAHSAQIGDFLGRLHGLGEDFAPRKSRRNLMEELEKDFDRLERAASSGKMKATLAGELAGLRDEFEAQCSRSMTGAAGLHHGGLVLRNALFRRGKLTLVRDFSRAGHGRFTMDLAIAINAWCWDASARQRGGPAGLYSPTRLEALLAAYTQRRPLTKTDYIALADDLRLSAVAGAIYRLVHYEMRASSDGLYEDFRHFTAKLEALAENRANELLEMAKPKRE